VNIYSEEGHCFKSTTGNYLLTQASFQIARAGGIQPTIKIAAFLYDTTGTYGSNPAGSSCRPINQPGTALANSTTYDTANLPSSFAAVQVDFSFTTTPAILNNHVYAIAVHSVGSGTVGVTAEVNIVRLDSNNAPLHAGNLFVWPNPNVGTLQYYNDTTSNLWFQFYGTPLSQPAGPAPGSAPLYYPGDAPVTAGDIRPAFNAPDVDPSPFIYIGILLFALLMGTYALFRKKDPRKFLEYRLKA
jgi:hypothetical protein